MLSAGRALAVMSGGPLLLLLLAIASVVATVVPLASGDMPPVVALVGDALIALYAGLFVPWTRSWGATHEEITADLAGDELVPDRGITMTRGITIDAPRAVVWPWLAQIGQDRAGFYSFTALENLAGCRMPRAERVHEEWQHRSVGEVVPLHPLNGLCVARFDPEHAYVFQGGWGFVLAPFGPGRTRLIARSRVPRGWIAVAYALLFELSHFVMERRMLLGIKKHVERSRTHASSRGRVVAAP